MEILSNSSSNTFIIVNSLVMCINGINGSESVTVKILFLENYYNIKINLNNICFKINYFMNKLFLIIILHFKIIFKK